MRVVSKGIAEFQTEASGEVLRLDGAQLDWDQIGGDERSMGQETIYEATAEIVSREGRTYEMKWELSEYPVGAVNNLIAHHPGLRMLSDIAVDIEHEEGD